MVSKWVATYIIHFKKPKNRAVIISKFLDITHACLKLNNFESSMQIISGLEYSGISRLKLTWGEVSKEHSEKLQVVMDLFSPTENYKNYRSKLTKVQLPCCPYLGLYLSTLTFMEDGNPDDLGPNHLINFQKYQMVAKILQEIQMFQSSQYCLRPVIQIQEYLCNLETLDEKTIYGISLTLEARRRNNSVYKL